MAARRIATQMLVLVRVQAPEEYRLAMSSRGLFCGGVAVTLSDAPLVPVRLDLVDGTSFWP